MTVRESILIGEHKVPVNGYQIYQLTSPRPELCNINTELHLLTPLSSNNRAFIVIRYLTAVYYNIHKDTTLETKLLHPMAEPRVGLNGGAEDNDNNSLMI